MIFSELPICDLRFADSIEDIRKIERIEEVAMVIFPEDADDEIKSALALIPQKEVALTVYVKKSSKISVVNGFSVIGDNSFSGSDDWIIANGMIIIDSLSENATGNIGLNGMAIVKSSLKDIMNVHFPMINGMVKYLDFEDFKIYQNTVELDADTLQYIDSKTVVTAGNKIELADDITVELLEEKGIILVAGNEISCRKNIAGYVKAKAFAGSNISVVDE